MNDTKDEGLTLQERNEQKSEGKSQAKSYGEAKPINDRLAFVFLVVVGICGIIISWAAAESPPHYTTIRIAAILAVLFSILAACFHWIPTKKETTSELPNTTPAQLSPMPEAIRIPPNADAQPHVFEAEHDRLAKEKVLLKIQNERLLEEINRKKLETTELQHEKIPSDKETEELAEHKSQEITTPIIPKEIQKSNAPDPDKPIYPPEFFNYGESSLWQEYTEDIFKEVSGDVIWRWHYKPEINNQPRNVNPYCPECYPPRPLEGFIYVDGQTGGDRVSVKCKHHATIRFDSRHNDYAAIKQLILRKLDNRTWIDVVNKQREARHQPRISPDIYASKRLHEAQERILITLWVGMDETSPYPDYVLEYSLNWLYKKQGEPKLDAAMLRHYLDELVSEKEYIKSETDHTRASEYSLTKSGREYFIKNKLNETDSYRFLKDAHSSYPN